MKIKTKQKLSERQTGGKQMKHTKRILSFALVLIMVFALCAPALADRSYEPYKYYMCVGDSIAAGCSLTNHGV